MALFVNDNLLSDGTWFVLVVIWPGGRWSCEISWQDSVVKIVRKCGFNEISALDSSRQDGQTSTKVTIVLTNG